jgi:ABC-type polysaccharide/polyol phosphate export permease
MRYIPVIKLLVGRELTLRYKRSVIGVGWTLLNPMLTSFVLWIVFSYVFSSKLPGSQQYAPYLFAGILLNNFFSQGMLASAEAIASNGSIFTKIYIPPQVFAVSSALASFVNFLIGLIPLIIVVYISGTSLSWTFPLTLYIAFLMILLVSGLGLILSITFIRFDDTRNVVNVSLLMMLYLTPVFYPLSALSPRLQEIIGFNPMTSFLNCFRWAYSTNEAASWGDWLYITSFSCGIFFLGVIVFKKYWSRTVTML